MFIYVLRKSQLTILPEGMHIATPIEVGQWVSWIMRPGKLPHFTFLNTDMNTFFNT